MVSAGAVEMTDESVQLTWERAVVKKVTPRGVESSRTTKVDSGREFPNTYWTMFGNDLSTTILRQQLVLVSTRLAMATASGIT
jgi:hypothetical protein